MNIKTTLIKKLQDRTAEIAILGLGYLGLPLVFGEAGFRATDLSPGQIEHLTCLLRETPGTAIIYDGVRPEWTSPGLVANSLLWNETLV